MPILGTIASSTRQGLSTNNFESIATVTLGSNNPSIGLNNIPQSYRHLQLRGLIKPQDTNGGTYRFQFNGVASAVYGEFEFSANGSATVQASNQGLTTIYIATAQGGQRTGQYGAFIVDILDYSDTTKGKVTRMQYGVDDNSAGIRAFCSGYYAQNTAITSIEFQAQGNGFVAGSTIAIYGIKD